MHPHPYPQSRLLLLEARVAACSWVLLALAGAAWFASKLSLPGSQVASYALLVIGLLTFIVHMVMAHKHRCPQCRRRPTVQGLKAIHPNAQGQSFMPGWEGATLNVLRRRRIVCIHCGTEFVVEA
jgi:hypothetical protein